MVVVADADVYVTAGADGRSAAMPFDNFAYGSDLAPGLGLVIHDRGDDLAAFFFQRRDIT